MCDLYTFCLNSTVLSPVSHARKALRVAKEVMFASAAEKILQGVDTYEKIVIKNQKNTHTEAV
jgi:hypothetical protein